MIVTREQLENLIKDYADCMYHEGHDAGQDYPFSPCFSFGYEKGISFILDLLFNPPPKPVKQPLGSIQAEIQAQCLLNSNIQACFMCGLPKHECDRIAEELGYDECEDLA